MVATATAVGAVARAVREGDGDPRGVGMGMMAMGSGSAPSWWDGSWRSMMGSMGWAGVASESEYLAATIAHHREAVAAAENLTRSHRSQMRLLGESIISTQSAQIRTMQDWLQEWYPDQTVDDDYEPTIGDLSRLSGDALDLAFLQDMIGHHMAAVMLSQNLLWRGAEHDEVADLARSIRDEQHAEILQMHQWLGQWFDVDWRGGTGCGVGPGRARGPGTDPPVAVPRSLVSGGWSCCLRV
ncbi:DUF305 domain-containing protein [Nocardioides pyridinolyticus]